ncbi:MAG: hypothetical protein RLZ95_576 [Bacteroidota bacterium]|jgi:hypothetical protein
MNDLGIYLHLGFKHIISWGAWDHILFVLVLTIRYQWMDWKKVLVLITAFTVGHSVTLALSTLNWIDFSSDLIEMLIPITILLTAVSNFWVKTFDFKSKYPLIYFLALFFGLIHGLGFSSYLKSLLGMEQSILGPLFTFNVGLELGQLLIVGIILIISFIFVSLIKVRRLLYLQIGSGIAIAFSLYMVIEKILPIIK